MIFLALMVGTFLTVFAATKHFLHIGSFPESIGLRQWRACAFAFCSIRAQLCRIAIHYLCDFMSTTPQVYAGRNERGEKSAGPALNPLKGSSANSSHLTHTC